MSVLRATHLLLLAFVSIGLPMELQSQGKGKGREDKQAHVVVVQQGHAKRHKGRKIHTSDEAVEVTRVVLREQGYDLVRVERRGDVRVVYYRRGNMGRGRGKGPIMYMVVRPSPDRIIIERAPSPLRVQINVRLGY